MRSARRFGRAPIGWFAVVGTLLLLELASTSEARAETATTPTTPIRHLIVLMQDNHSFDNYFGGYPEADGIPPLACMPVAPDDASGPCIRPFHVAGASITGLDDSASTYRLQYHGGRLDGFVHAFVSRNRSGNQAMGYYDRIDLPLSWNIADSYVLFDRFFASAAGGSFQNRMFWVAGVPGGPPSKRRGFDAVPTIFDRLDQAGVPWKFYVEDYDPTLSFRTGRRQLQESGQGRQVRSVPLLNFARFVDDPRLEAGIVDLEQFFADLQNERLPAVSYIAPIASSEKPPASPNAGQKLLRGLLNALMSSYAWKDSALLVTYDSWGGWYDHVAPPRVDEDGYGFRVPTFLVSPYARTGHIDHTTLDYTSILRFIEDNYGLEALASRDARAASIAGAFDFSQPPRHPSILPIAAGSVEGPPKAPKGALYAYAMGIALGALLIVGAAAVSRFAKPLEGTVVPLPKRRER